MALASNSVIVHHQEPRPVSDALWLSGLRRKKLQGSRSRTSAKKSFAKQWPWSKPSVFLFLFHLADVSDLQQVKRLADESVEKHGRVTHLINNAGVGLVGTFEQISIEDFQWLMENRFLAMVYGCKVFLPILRQQEFGPYY